MLTKAAVECLFPFKISSIGALYVQSFVLKYTNLVSQKREVRLSPADPVKQHCYQTKVVCDDKHREVRFQCPRAGTGQNLSSHGLISVIEHCAFIFSFQRVTVVR